MDEVSTKLADVVEQTADLINITNDSHDVDHAQIIEEFNSFVRNNPDIENVSGEHLRHGLGESCTLPAVFLPASDRKSVRCVSVHAEADIGNSRNLLGMCYGLNGQP